MEQVSIDLRITITGKIDLNDSSSSIGRRKCDRDRDRGHDRDRRGNANVPLFTFEYDSGFERLQSVFILRAWLSPRALQSE